MPMGTTAQAVSRAGRRSAAHSGNRTGAVGGAEHSRSSRDRRSGLPSGSGGVASARRALLRVLPLTILAAAVPLIHAADSATGLEHLRAGRVDEALAQFKGVLEGNPDDLAALNMVGAILCIRNEPASSIVYFERALRISPEFVPARKNLAIAQFDLGRLQSAEANLLELLGVPEARMQASLFLGMIRSESGRHSDAVRLLEDAGDLIAGQPRALIAYARSLQQVGRSNNAGEVLSALQARGDLTGPDLVDLAQVAAAAERYDEALAALERAEALDPAPEGLGVRRIAILAAAGQDEEALALARMLANEVPDRRLLSRLAGLEESAGNLDASILALRRAIQVAPENEDGYIELSEFCVRYRNPELALEILDLGLNRRPASYRLLVQKGITLGQGQRYEAARKAFSDAVGLRADHSVALTALAVTLIHLEEVPEALETLRTGTERFPEDFYVHYVYAFAVDRSRAGRDRGQEALSEKHFRIAIKLNDRFPSAYYRLGKLLAEKETAEAIRNLEAAVRLDPSLTAAKYQLGQLYLDSGREEEGARLMREIGETKQRELEEEQMPQFRAVKAAPNQ